jgi:hypothetical protein
MPSTYTYRLLRASEEAREKRGAERRQDVTRRHLTSPPPLSYVISNPLKSLQVGSQPQPQPPLGISAGSLMEACLPSSPTLTPNNVRLEALRDRRFFLCLL